MGLMKEEKYCLLLWMNGEEANEGVFEFVVFHFLYSYPKTQRESCVVFKD
jgi:hypothetical protein